jgi:hypothetical protein
MGVIPELGLAEEIPTGNTMWCKPPPRAPSTLVMLPEMSCLQPPVGVNYFDIQSAAEDKTP